MTKSVDRKQLTWMCRRGTRELDRMTRYYLDNHYDNAGKKQRETFARMLQLSDPELQDILIYGRGGEDEGINAVAEFIRQSYHD